MLRPLTEGELSPIPAANKNEYFIKSLKALSNDHDHVYHDEEEDRKKESFNSMRDDHHLDIVEPER